MFKGLHLDDVLAYETRKIVLIRDRRLGLTYWSFVVCIAIYVVGYQILYLNGHFEKKDVEGTARMTIQQPTRNGCNPNKPGCKSDFRALTELPYCNVYNGSLYEVTPKFRHPCIFADQHTLAPTGMLQGEMLVPTRIDQMYERKGCTPSAANGYTCDNEYELDEKRDTHYVADIERFTIMVSHTYRRGHIEGNNINIEGQLLECETDDEDTVMKAAASKTKDVLLGRRECKGSYIKKPIQCISNKCPFLKKKRGGSFLQGFEKVVEDATADVPVRSGHHRVGSKSGKKTALVTEEADNHEAANPAELLAGGYFAIPQGDIFRIDKLLELSGVSLDYSINSEGEPLRESGTVLLIEIFYTNMHPFLSSFGFTDVSYYYKVTRRPMDEMKTEFLSVGQHNYPNTRSIENRHGLYIIVKVGGEFGFFSIVYLLIMLTTAIALISAANVITDKLAIYAMSEKETYCEHKYEITDRIVSKKKKHRKESESNPDES